MRRETRQLSLAEALVGGGKGGARLERITGTIDWGALDGLLAELRASRTGRPGWPPLAMLKALLLAQWYGLSDPELEDALSDRLSFRRFVGLPLDGGVPDETTLCRFRNELVRRGLTERLLAAVDAQLAGRGLVLKRGTLIDASLVEADADVRKGPDGQPVTVEPEAGFAKRRGKAFFGFKAHLAVDEGSGLVRRAVLTPANVNESVVADALPIGDEAAVYADKGYDSAARRGLLAERGVFDGIMRRGHPRRPLTAEEVARNRALVPIRSAIERVFGTLKRSYRWTRVRYRGLARNAAHLDLLCLALNLRRVNVLTR
jgi:transposase, IS5 family